MGYGIRTPRVALSPPGFIAGSRFHFKTECKTVSEFNKGPCYFHSSGTSWPEVHFDYPFRFGRDVNAH